MTELSPELKLNKELANLVDFAMDIYTMPPEPNTESQSCSDVATEAIIHMIADQFVVQHELSDRGISVKGRLKFFEPWSKWFWLQTRLMALGPL